MKIGVVALQGAFIEHIALLQRLEVEAIAVRLPEELEGLDGIVLPGGESTTIGTLMVLYGLLEPLRRAIAAGTPIYGTCAGMILLARDSGSTEQPLLGAMDIVVKRNAFGRQRDSFEQDIVVAACGSDPFRAIFIRAPAIERVGPTVQELGHLDDGTIVAVQQGTMLATAFHPELSGDVRLHQHFLSLCVQHAQEVASA